MSKIYELYLQILIQQQYSPTITTISRYEPDNFINDENPLMMADKIRVLRYRSEKIIFKESTLNNYLFQFSNNRNLFIHFLRRLTSPIFDYELQDQKSIENIILQIELDSILLEQIGLWNNNFNLTIQQLEAIFLCQKMNEFQQCLLNIKQNQLNQICQINEYDLKHETEITLPNFEYFEQQFYQCNYKINSKKKVVQFTHKKELCQSDQNKIIKIIQKKKLQNIRDVFQLIMNQFGLQFNINYQELQNNNEWICELSAKEIYTKQKSNNKSQAFLNAQIHVLKQISPLILDFLLENSDQNLDQIKQNKGLLNLKISVLKQCGIMPKEDFLRLVPYNYELIENYIESKPNTETCAIRKLQNDITNYLITKYHQLGVNKQLLSIASTYELTMSFSDGQETKTINKIFTTKLRFCNARLIGQQYIINVIGERIFGREKCEQFETIEQFLQQLQ